MKKPLIVLAILAFVIAPAVARAQSSHEYSPLTEQAVNYKNWTLPNLTTDKQEDLRKLVAGKKLVMVVYFAPWCGNWRNEAPIAAKLYEKYKAQGFQVVGVSEYAMRDEVRNYFGKDGPPYPVVTESESREDKQKTPHYQYRQLTGDKRNWGSPWNIFLEPAKLSASGDVLTEKAWVVNGELIEDEVDKFIASKVGAATATVIEPCKP
ncbi:MAG TPA: TlpA disulfide reductase family protein [Pyrinomonadaceae bacterium]|jgi:thiol-disulfide isomerase/thioredoxin|nr:TlpA disulfide reductase family protein [Pyrinomonadaceae bacterium]